MWTSKKFIIAICTLVLVAIGIITPFTIPSGLDKFQGVERHAAQYMIGDAWKRASGINYSTIAGTLVITVDNVVADNKHNTQCNGEFKDSSQGGADNYFVTINYRTLLGIPFKTTTFHVCRDR